MLLHSLIRVKVEILYVSYLSQGFIVVVWAKGNCLCASFVFVFYVAKTNSASLHMNKLAPVTVAPAV